MEYSFATQSIGLTGVVNARELGGYVFPGGRMVRKGLLLRGGSLVNATEEDLAILQNKFHLAHCFDFRTDIEVKHAPDKTVPGAEHHWMPTIDPTTEEFGTTNLPPDAYRDLMGYLVANACHPMVQNVARSMYPEMVRNEYTQLQYAAFLQIIANTEDGAVYWHCSQGKDRTGLGAALVLAVLGADREMIMKDFSISNEYYAVELKESIDRVRAAGGGDAGEDAVRTFIGVNEAYFSQALDIIDTEFGSMMEYLTGPLCLTEEDISRMRDRLLV